MWEVLPVSHCRKTLGPGLQLSDADVTRARDALYVLARLVLRARADYDPARSESAQKPFAQVKEPHATH